MASLLDATSPTSPAWSNLSQFQAWAKNQPNLAGLNTNTVIYTPTGKEAKAFQQMAQLGAAGMADLYSRQTGWTPGSTPWNPNVNDINAWTIDPDTNRVMPRDFLGAIFPATGEKGGAVWMKTPGGGFEHPVTGEPWGAGYALGGGSTGAGRARGAPGAALLGASGIGGEFPMLAQIIPDIGIGQPGSQFSLYGGLADTLRQMMSQQPNMDIWGPAMDEATRRLTQVWQEQTLPGIRSEAQAAGQLGGPRNALQLQGAADKFSQNLGNTQSLLAAQAAQSAQDQRNLAAQLGLDVTKLQDASRIADIQGLLDQARIYEAGRATNLNAMVGMRGQNYNYDLGWGELNLNRDQLQSQQALALLGLQQNAQLGGLGQLGPMLQALGYPAGLLGNLGNYQYNRDASYLGDVGRIYGGSVQGPLGALQAYNWLIGNPYGTQTQYSYGPSPLQGAIGGALTGYGIYNQGTQNNWW